MRKPQRAIRLLVDGRVLNTPHLRGMGKALLYLLREGVRASPDDKLMVVGDRTDCGFHSEGLPGVEHLVLDIPGYRFRSWEQAMLPWLVRRHRAEVVFCPASMGPLIQRVPHVITVHDALWWVEGRPGFARDCLAPAVLRRTAAVVTDSVASKTDLEQRFAFLRKRVSVIPLGVASEYLEGFPSRNHTPEALPTVVYFGGHIPRKRLEWAVRVWRASPTSQLVLCGITAERADECWRLFTLLERPRVTVAGTLSEEAVINLLRSADVVVYPTLYEGFGLPALEAQAVGVPILMSRTSSLLELEGPLATLLEAEDEVAWVSALTARIRTAPELCDVEASKVFASAFSWSKCWERYRNLFSDLVERRRT